MRAVSLVPPVYYADLVATRAKCYLNKRDGKLATIIPEIQEKMFFAWTSSFLILEEILCIL